MSISRVSLVPLRSARLSSLKLAKKNALERTAWIVLDVSVEWDCSVPENRKALEPGIRIEDFIVNNTSSC